LYGLAINIILVVLVLVSDQSCSQLLAAARLGASQ